MSAEAKLTELKQRLAEISDLERLAGLAGWDQHTMMPPAANDARAEQAATIHGLIHERATSPEIGRLLEDLRDYEEGLPEDSDDRALIRVARRDYEKKVRVPVELASEMARADGLAFPAWAEARETSNYQLFLPHLEKHVELKRRYIECFDGGGDTYDILLDDYEEGATAAEVARVFARVKEALVPLIADVGRNGGLDTGFMHGDYPIDEQRRFSLEVLERMGFDAQSWRLDPTLHPFCISLAITDIRLTTRYSETDFESLYHAVHEFGHGVYERNVDPAFDRTPLAALNSMGLHESQSRLWENLVARSRPFWEFFFPRLQAAFPGPLDGVEVDDVYRGVNRIEPGLIRVDADEVTYPLHIILRFELEQEMLTGALPLRDVPEAWNEKMKEYLGLDVPDDRRGVLQDVHWSGGSFGYFPTYALGTIISVQIWERLREEAGDVDDQLRHGEFGSIREWLAENLYRHGRKYPPSQMVERIVGRPLDAEPYLRYLKQKAEDVYGVTV